MNEFSDFHDFVVTDQQGLSTWWEFLKVIFKWINSTTTKMHSAKYSWLSGRYDSNMKLSTISIVRSVIQINWLMFKLNNNIIHYIGVNFSVRNAEFQQSCWNFVVVCKIYLCYSHLKLISSESTFLSIRGWRNCWHSFLSSQMASNLCWVAVDCFNCRGKWEKDNSQGFRSKLNISRVATPEIWEVYIELCKYFF